MRNAPPTAHTEFMHGRPRARPRRRAGFTLIEAALTTVIVGVGVLAMVAAQQAFHQKNAWSMNSSTAVALANHIREATWDLPQHDPVTGCFNWGPEVTPGGEVSVEFYDDVDDFDGPDGTGLEFHPPINSRREEIPSLDNWFQTVFVKHVNPFDVNEVIDEVGDNCETKVMKVTVLVEYTTAHSSDREFGTEVWWIVPSE